MNELPAIIKESKPHRLSIRIGLYHDSTINNEVADFAVSLDTLTQPTLKKLTPDTVSVRYNYKLSKNLAGWLNFQETVLDELLQVGGSQITLDRKELRKLLKDSSIILQIDYIREVVVLSHFTLGLDLRVCYSIVRKGQMWRVKESGKDKEVSLERSALSLLQIDDIKLSTKGIEDG